MSGWAGVFIMLGLLHLGDAIKYAARTIASAMKEKK